MSSLTGPYRSEDLPSKGSGPDPKQAPQDELYQDLRDFAETKRKIEALIRFKQSLIDQENSPMNIHSLEFARYKLQAMNAIDQLFDACRDQDTPLA
jgi:hypothetical protein